jgi:hypothetical protein
MEAISKTARTEQVSASRLADIADQPDTTVYGYVYDVPSTTLRPEVQVELYRDIVAGFDDMCVRHPDLCDEGLRELILQTKDACLFQTLYPKVFASSTYRALCPEMEERLDKTRKISMYMLAERLHGEGDDDEKAARAMCAGMRVSMRDTRAEDIMDGVQLAAPDTDANADADGDADGDAAATAALAKLTPMDRREFGDSTVRQGQAF